MSNSDPPPVVNWADPGSVPLLVGRASEIAGLNSLLEATERGSGGMILIHGEAGIGKTRLLAELRSRAIVQGIDPLVGQCQERDRGIPYGPWIEILRLVFQRSSKELVRRVVQGNRSAVVQLVPEIGGKVWLHDAGSGGAGELDGPRFLAALGRVFQALSKEGPVVIVLDDLGWADSGTLDMLTVLGGISRGQRLAVVAAYRDGHVEENPALGSFLRGVQQTGLATQLVPHPLDDHDIGRLIQSANGGRQATGRFRRTVWERSRGNPFFAVQILRALSETGSLRDAESPDESGKEPAFEIPASVQGVIAQRLTRLDEGSRRALRVASLLGFEFSFDLLETVSRLDEELLMTSLESALQHRLIVAVRTATDGTIYAFAHPLIQEVLAAEVGPDRSRRIHLRAARALVASSAEGDTAAASLAFHYLRANDAPMALRYSIRAGDRAATLFARTDAIGHYRTALSLLSDHPDPSTSAQVLNSLATQLSIVGDYGGAVNCLAEAARLEESLGNRVRAGSLMAQAALTVWSPREFRPQEDQLQQARTILEAAAPSAELAQLYLDHATLIAKRGRLAEARTLLTRSLEAAKAVGNRSAEASVHLVLAQMVALGGRAEVLRELKTALDLARVDSPATVMRTYHLLALFAAYGYADLEECARWMDVATESSAGRENPTVLATIRGGAGSFAALMRGDLVEARRRSVEFREFLRSHGLPASAHNLLMIGTVDMLSGDTEGAEAALHQAEGTYSLEEGWFQDLWLGGFVARLALLRGEFSRSREEFSRWLDALRQRGAIELDAFLGVLYLSGLVEATAGLGALEESRGHLRELARVCAQVGGSPAAAHLSRAEAQLAAAEGRTDEAVEGFRRSVTLWSGSGWKIEWARDLASLSKVLAARGDHAESAALRAQAEELCEHAGARLDLARIRAEAPSPTKKPPRPSSERRGRRPHSAGRHE